MNNILLLFISISLIFPTITYVVTDNFISTAIVFLMTALYFFLYAYQKFRKTTLKNKRFHSCYLFINTFIVSISIQQSLLAAFEQTKLLMDKEYQEIIDGVSNLNEEERLDYLKKHFDFDIYYLFLSVMHVWIEQGGDIFTIAHYLVDESKRNEDYLIKCESIAKRKIVSFSILWIFTLFIVIALRFTLNSFYSIITNFLLFQVAIIILFIVVILSIHLFIIRMINIDVRGYKDA